MRQDRGEAAVWQWLDGHVNRETGVGVAPGGSVQPAPSLDVINQLLHALGQPQRRVPAVLVAGTNGKTTTARILAALLQGSGLRVGLYTSPHLHRPHERIAIGDKTITDAQLTTVIHPLVEFEHLHGARASWFELMTAAAIGWFAQEHVDVAVVETGLGGAGDASAAVGAQVIVVTSVGVDHVEYFGPSRFANAVAEASVVPYGATVVLAEPDRAMHPPFLARRPAVVLSATRDFGVVANTPGANRRTISLFTPTASYEDLFLGLLAPRQTASAATALAAAEAWLGTPVADLAARSVLAAVRSPGRFELVHTPHPVVLDGAHNAAAARALAGALREQFPGAPRTIVVGMTGERDPLAFLLALGVGTADRVICTRPDTPRAVPPDAVASAAHALSAGSEVIDASVGDAVRRAVGQTDDTLTVITGSLHVVSEALPVARSLAI